MGLDHPFEVEDAPRSPPAQVGGRRPAKAEQYVDRADVLLLGQRLHGDAAYPFRDVLACHRYDLPPNRW